MSEQRYSEDEVRAAVQAEIGRWGGTVTHPDAPSEVVARLREGRGRPLRVRYNPTTENFELPTPAAMLGEALEHLARAAPLLEAVVVHEARAGRGVGDVYLSAADGNGDLGRLVRLLRGVKREAEVREGQG